MPLPVGDAVDLLEPSDAVNLRSVVEQLPRRHHAGAVALPLDTQRPRPDVPRLRVEPRYQRPSRWATVGLYGALGSTSGTVCPKAGAAVVAKSTTTSTVGTWIRGIVATVSLLTDRKSKCWFVK